MNVTESSVDAAFDSFVASRVKQCKALDQAMAKAQAQLEAQAKALAKAQNKVPICHDKMFVPIEVPTFHAHGEGSTWRAHGAVLTHGAPVAVPKCTRASLQTRRAHVAVPPCLAHVDVPPYHAVGDIMPPCHPLKFMPSKSAFRMNMKHIQSKLSALMEAKRDVIWQKLRPIERYLCFGNYIQRILGDAKGQFLEVQIIDSLIKDLQMFMKEKKSEFDILCAEMEVFQHIIISNILTSAESVLKPLMGVSDLVASCLETENKAALDHADAQMKTNRLLLQRVSGQVKQGIPLTVGDNPAAKPGQVKQDVSMTVHPEEFSKSDSDVSPDEGQGKKKKNKNIFKKCWSRLRHKHEKKCKNQNNHECADSNVKPKPKKSTFHQITRLYAEFRHRH